MDFSKYVNDLQNKAKTDKSLDIEKEAMDYLGSLDFSDPQNVAEAENYLGTFINDKLGKNVEVSRLEAKVAHMLVTKMALQEVGFGDTKLNYRPRKPDEHAGAFYDENENAITFFDENICNERGLLKPYGNDVERGAKSRMDYFNRQIFVAYHEVQHVPQFNKRYEDPTEMTSFDYQKEKQRASRWFTGQKGSKYEKYKDDLYSKNHDAFIFETEADIAGYKGAMDLTKRVSPKAYELGCDKHIGWDWKGKLEKRQNELLNQQNVVWNHETNPKDVAVVANHKATMINDEVFPNLRKEDRKWVENKFSSFKLVYNEDGSKKTLDEIEQMRADKMKAISQESIPAEEKNKKRLQTAELFETIVESDPVYSYERCLQRIARARSGNYGVITDRGIEIRNGQKEIREQGEKAAVLASYLEGVEYKDTSKIFSKYQKEARKMTIKNRSDQFVYEERNSMMRKLDMKMMMNTELNQAKKDADAKRRDEYNKKQEQQQKAKQTLKEVFPDFEPHPKVCVLDKDSVHIYQNHEEKLLLEHSIKQYTKDVYKRAPDQKFVPISDVRNAINTLYNEPVPSDVKESFEEKVLNDEVESARNMMQPKPEKEDIQQVEQESTITPISEQDLAKVEPALEEDSMSQVEQESTVAPISEQELKDARQEMEIKEPELEIHKNDKKQETLEDDNEMQLKQE